MSNDFSLTTLVIFFSNLSLSFINFIFICSSLTVGKINIFNIYFFSLFFLIPLSITLFFSFSSKHKLSFHRFTYLNGKSILEFPDSINLKDIKIYSILNYILFLCSFIGSFVLFLAFLPNSDHNVSILFEITVLIELLSSFFFSFLNYICFFTIKFNLETAQSN